MSRRTGHLRVPVALTLVVSLAVGAACSRSEKKDPSPGSGQPPAIPPPTLTLFGLAELRGQIGPCGCTTDPLGDLARTAHLVHEARAAGPTIVVDAGSLLYSTPRISAAHAAQEELKADLLARAYREHLDVAAVGLGWADLAAGVARTRIPRHAVNVAPQPGLAVAEPRVLAVGAARVGIFGVVAPDAIKPDVGLTVGDPIAAGTAAAAALRGQGAQVVVALIQAGSKREAVRILSATAGVDLAIAGLGLETPEPELVDPGATRVGDAWMVVPGNRGQVISRIDVTLREPSGPLGDAGGAAAARARAAGLERQLAALDVDLARYAADPTADPAYVRRKQAERAALVAQRDRARARPLEIPASGSYFTLEQIRVNKTRACSQSVQDAVTAFYRAAGAANVSAAAQAPPPPPVPPGAAQYVGNAACEDCHSDAFEHWQRTRHARAWKTLVDRGQQFDLDCIACHVTGWGQPSGATLARNEPLRDVGCETCHGPGSIHVAKGGEDRPSTMIRNPPPQMCATQCHTKEHSDTFLYEAYLRDVVGPGHGADVRAKLGAGPTGSQLRKAGLAKAGSKGPGCVR